MSDYTRINGYNVGGVQKKPLVNKPKADQVQEEEVKKHVAPEHKNIPANEILNQMAAGALPVGLNKISNETAAAKTKKVIEVSKYVTPEQAQRIAGYVSEAIDTLFQMEEAAVVAGLKGNSAKTAATLAFTSQYLAE